MRKYNHNSLRCNLCVTEKKISRMISVIHTDLEMRHPFYRDPLITDFPDPIDNIPFEWSNSRILTKRNNEDVQENK